MTIFKVIVVASFLFLSRQKIAFRSIFASISPRETTRLSAEVTTWARRLKTKHQTTGILL